MQSFLSKTSSLSHTPQFSVERNFAVVRNESHQLHLVVHQIRSKLGVLTPVCRGAALLKSAEPGQQSLVSRGCQSSADPAPELCRLQTAVRSGLQSGVLQTRVSRTLFCTVLFARSAQCCQCPHPYASADHHGSTCAGVAIIDILQYFEPSVDSQSQRTRLDATQTLTESGILVATAHETASGRKEPGVFTLRLPLLSAKAAAAEIASAAASSAGIDEDDDEMEYIQIRVQPANVEQVEETFWQQLVSLVDWDNSGALSKPVCSAACSEQHHDGHACRSSKVCQKYLRALPCHHVKVPHRSHRPCSPELAKEDTVQEFMRLMHGVMDPSDMEDELLEKLWQQASNMNPHNDGVTADELAKVRTHPVTAPVTALVALCHTQLGCSVPVDEHTVQVITELRSKEGLNLLRRCPVSGATLSDTDSIGNFIYMLFQMDAGMGKNLQGGTFRTAAQVRPHDSPALVKATLATKQRQSQTDILNLCSLHSVVAERTR